MDQSLLSRIFSKIAVAILSLALLDLLYLNWWVIKNQRSNIKDQKLEQARTVEAIPSPTPEVSPLSGVGEPKTETKTVETNPPAGGEKQTPSTSSGQGQTIVQTAQKEIFIPIGSGSTKKNGYDDLAGLEVTVDTGKYSAIESVVFEASIWVQDGNGKMFTQLYNVSDKHPVWNSEISTNSAKGVLTTSPKITLDGGARTYQVQAKTNLTEFAAHVENARIKITLK